MRRFVIGDIHGRFEALKEVLKKSKFHYQNDKLIVLGDIVDGGPRTYEVVEELLKIKNIIFIIGNHDEWWMNHIKSGWAEHIWLSQGGVATVHSYGGVIEREEKGLGYNRFYIDASECKVPVTHQDFFNRGKYYHVEDNMCFVHGGFNPYTAPQYTKKEDLLWDRALITFAMKHPVPKFDKVFVGHTTTQMYGNLPDVDDCMAPIKFNNLIMMDCGAGWNGKLAIMDIDTEEFWTSEQQRQGR